eukprot:412464-Alexandrium_andersonii.AAC.1
MIRQSGPTPNPAAIRTPCAIRNPQHALGGRKQPQMSPSKASSRGLGVILRAESDGDDEAD